MFESIGLNFEIIRLYVSYFFLLFGVVDLLIGMIGLIRLPDVYNRLHATTKIATTGAFFVLLSILIRDGFTPLGLKAIAIGFFLLMTAPVAGHVIARAAYHINVPPCNQTIYDAYVGKRQGDYCDSCDFHEGSFVYLNFENRNESDHAGSDHFEEHLIDQFSDELSGLYHAADKIKDEEIPNPIPSVVEDNEDDGELITGSESPEKAAAEFDQAHKCNVLSADADKTESNESDKIESDADKIE